MFLVSCRKETIEPKVEETKTITYEQRNAAHTEFKLNGKVINLPIQSKKGDVLEYWLACQPSTPKRTDLYVNIYVNGIKEAGCVNVYEFKGKLTIQ